MFALPPSAEQQEPREMMDTKTARAKPIGHTDNRVIEVAYALAKSKSDESAHEIMHGIPRAILPELLKHMKAHSNLFPPAIHAMVAGGIDAPQVSKAEALFS
jgi:hypothetical protein